MTSRDNIGEAPVTGTIAEKQGNFKLRGVNIMNRVFVLSCDRKPLMPCHPARARMLLKGGWASVFRRKPFTIILNYKIDKPSVQKTRIKLDPGSKQTGISVVALGKRGWKVMWAGVLEHRGDRIKKLLEKRRNARRSRRSRKTRYRKPRFLNRVRPKGWLPPSLMSRVDNILTWVNRLCRFCHVDGISVEHVKFDVHRLKNPEVRGIEYQWGTLFGYEVKEYLLEKWGHKCAYCNKKNVPLEVEHIIPKSRGGSNLVTNLTIACRECNMKKGNKTAAEFGYPKLEKEARQSFKDAAAVNSTRLLLVRKLRLFSKKFNLTQLVRCTGARTKYNRIKQGYPKEHWIDAACACKSGRHVFIPDWMEPLEIKAMGWGSRQMCRVDKYGFPRTSAKKSRVVNGFRTGDIVKAVVTKGKKIGTYVGRVVVRTNGRFDIRTCKKLVQSISWKYCTVLQYGDGYAYN